MINALVLMLHLSCSHSDWAGNRCHPNNFLIPPWILSRLFFICTFFLLFGSETVCSQVSVSNWPLQILNLFCLMKCFIWSYLSFLQWSVRCALWVCHSSSSTSTWTLVSPEERRRKAWGGKTFLYVDLEQGNVPQGGGKGVELLSPVWGEEKSTAERVQ